jgi:hypothetical protein
VQEESDFKVELCGCEWEERRIWGHAVPVPSEEKNVMKKNRSAIKRKK